MIGELKNLEVPSLVGINYKIVTIRNRAIDSPSMVGFEPLYQT